MTTHALRSPIPWLGGKYYSAARIVAAFPPAAHYEVFVDLFGGAAHVLLAKAPDRHAEVYNDINGDLVNFWMQCRDHAEVLEARCRSLPYSRDLYYQYHGRLYSGEVLESLERAILWFYVQRSSFTSWERASAPGWKGTVKATGVSDAQSYRHALDLFASLQQRWQHILIDQRDFAAVLQSYSRPRTLFYVDPPYVGSEHYYQHPFTHADHERLAALLNASPALVALSYYPHPLVDALYPDAKWRRLSWEVAKHSQRTKAIRARAHELLLVNYPEPALSLWQARA